MFDSFNTKPQARFKTMNMVVIIKNLIFVLLMLPILSVSNAKDSFTQLSIDELMNQQVTSVGKKSQSLTSAASAIYVISSEDISNFHLRSIPEALKMVPGMNVNQIDGNRWAIGARSHGSRFSNTLLVLVDGRSIFSTVYGGVYWEQLDFVMKDIERIEVIRGPGATLWGSNAVNGVINIITKSAHDTKGAYSKINVGSINDSISARYGFELSEQSDGRIYLKYNQQSGLKSISEEIGDDKGNLKQFGFRFDNDLSKGGSLSLQGDVHRANLSDVFQYFQREAPYFGYIKEADANGWNILTKWQQPVDLTSDFSLQINLDGFYRDQLPFYTEKTNSFDVDFQYRKRLLSNHEILWGLSMRRNHVNVSGIDARVPNFNVDPNIYNKNLTTWSGFIQDEIELIDNKLLFTIGSKFENNDISGTEIQPSARLFLHATEDMVLWSAVSRAARVPSVIVNSVALPISTIAPLTSENPTPYPAYAALTADNSLGSETLTAYELGFRSQFNSKFSVDLATYYHRYNNSWLLGGTSKTLIFENGAPQRISSVTKGLDGGGYHVYGFELTTDWQPNSLWHVSANYSFTRNSDPLNPSKYLIGKLPEHKISIRTLTELTHNIRFSTWFRYSSSAHISPFDIKTPKQYIPSYFDVDLGVHWRVSPQFNVSVVGRNLLDSRHQESVNEVIATNIYEVPRSVFIGFEMNY